MDISRRLNEAPRRLESSMPALLCGNTSPTHQACGMGNLWETLVLSMTCAGCMYSIHPLARGLVWCPAHSFVYIETSPKSTSRGVPMNAAWSSPKLTTASLSERKVCRVKSDWIGEGNGSRFR